MAVALPEEVYIYICTVPPDGGTSLSPTGCDMRGPFKSSVLQEDTTGPTQEQYEQVFGAIMMVVVMIIIISLIKKAIEQ